MAMIPMTEVLPEILPSVDACPNPVAQRALRDTMMDFCRRSEAWHYRDEYVPTIADLGEMELPLPENTRLIKILSLSYNGRVLNAASEKVLDNQVANWRKETGEPFAFFELSGSRVRLYPTPESTTVGCLQATYALSPTRQSTVIDEHFFDEWLEWLVAGTVGRLRMMGDQPWTDTDRAPMDMAKYEYGLEQARRYSRNDHQAKPMRVTSYGGL
ncbi:hypothetical protein [Endozoicomonas ascidiicola]|uniref:phage adaptor protein n=1 Tax=Endozoicomonas ascidiicola TaxID=1698521 RepID=UPI00083586C4|nr:hypothetical protein [Endozoicomonas ascidiicola]